MTNTGIITHPGLSMRRSSKRHKHRNRGMNPSCAPCVIYEIAGIRTRKCLSDLLEGKASTYRMRFYISADIRLRNDLDPRRTLL